MKRLKKIYEGWKCDVEITDPSNPPIQLPTSKIPSKFTTT